MSEQRHDSGSLTLTEEDLGVDPESPEPPSTVDAEPPPSEGGSEISSEQKKRLRRTVRIPDDEVARPSKPPAPAPSAPSVSQPILGQRIIAIGAPLPAPSVPPPAPAPRPPSVAPRPPSVAPRARVPSVVELAPASEQLADSEQQPVTEPQRPASIPPTPPKVQDDDSWTPYQPRVASEPPPAPPPQQLVSPLVNAPAAPLPPGSSPSLAGLPPSQRRPSVQFEAPPVWARPPGPRPLADSRPGFEGSVTSVREPSRPSFGSSPAIHSAASSVVDLATPPPGQPWGPPRDSIVDVAVDFESDVTLLDVGAEPSSPVVAGPPKAEAPIHSRVTRIDDSELHGGLPTGYVAEPADLSSSHLEVDAPSGDLDGEAGPPSIDEVDIEPDSDSRPSGDLLAADDLGRPHAPPPPPKLGDKSGPPAPRLGAPNLLGLGNLAPLPLTDAASQRKKGRPWWEDLFNDDFVRTFQKGYKDETKAEVDFIEDSLGMEKGATILDLACGTGRHAIELSKRGYRMVGFDLSLAMLARAADLAQAEDQRINFVQGDMREMQFEEAFDGVYSWNTSFGYFEEDKNAQVAQLVHRALRKGGQFLLDIVNRDYIIQESPTTAWFEGDACICMDEMHIDWITSRMRVKRTIMFDDGRSRELEYSVRLYSLHELGRLLHEAGFRVTEVSGLLSTPGVFFGCQSPRTMILAEKR